MCAFQADANILVMPYLKSPNSGLILSVLEYRTLTSAFKRMRVRNGSKGSFKTPTRTYKYRYKWQWSVHLRDTSPRVRFPFTMSQKPKNAFFTTPSVAVKVAVLVIHSAILLQNPICIGTLVSLRFLTRQATHRRCKLR